MCSWYGVKVHIETQKIYGDLFRDFIPLPMKRSLYAKLSIWSMQTIQNSNTETCSAALNY